MLHDFDPPSQLALIAQCRQADLEATALPTPQRRVA
jgi:hypothetical protein